MGNARDGADGVFNPDRHFARDRTAGRSERHIDDDVAVIVDLAAETGGNCELTEPGQTIEHNDVTIHGPLNVPSLIPVHASETYAKNVFNFLSPFVKNGELALDWNDEVVAKSCLTHDGQIRHEPTRKLVG